MFRHCRRVTLRDSDALVVYDSGVERDARNFIRARRHGGGARGVRRTNEKAVGVLNGQGGKRPIFKMRSWWADTQRTFFVDRVLLGPQVVPLRRRPDGGLQKGGGSRPLARSGHLTRGPFPQNLLPTRFCFPHEAELLPCSSSNERRANVRARALLRLTT